MFKALVILVLSVTPAFSTPMVCTPLSNADVLAKIEKSSDETLRYVGILIGTNSPVELTVSDKGSWTLLAVSEYGVCFLAIGTSWQAVEPKPPGIND